MTPSRMVPVLVLGSMVGSMVVIVWVGYVGWRKRSEHWAVREIKAAVEANEPGRFLDAVDAVDNLGLSEAAADGIASLRHHASPRVRMYAIMAQTVLRRGGPSEAQELMALFDDPDEDIDVRCVGFLCLGLLESEHKLTIKDVPSVERMMSDPDDPRRSWILNHLVIGDVGIAPIPNGTRREKAEYVLMVADPKKWADAYDKRRRAKYDSQ